MGFREEILKRVEKAKDLPTLPGIFAKLGTMLANRNSSAHDIADIMRDDPALTAKVLKVTNSAAYGGSEKIVSVPQAIARIGFTKTGEIARSLSVINLFKGEGAVNYGDFWRHSLSVASATALIPRYMKKSPQAPGELFTAGLLHDVGIFVCERYSGDLYRSVLSMARDMGKELHETEQQLMQTDHAEVGAILLNRWNLPESIADAVSKHHKPHEKSDGSLTTAEIVRLANLICNSRGIANGTGAGHASNTAAALMSHGFAEDDIPKITDEINAIVEKSSAMLAANIG